MRMKKFKPSTMRVRIIPVVHCIHTFTIGTIDLGMPWTVEPVNSDKRIANGKKCVSPMKRRRVRLHSSFVGFTQDNPIKSQLIAWNVMYCMHTCSRVPPVCRNMLNHIFIKCTNDEFDYGPLSHRLNILKRLRNYNFESKPNRLCR